VGPGFQLDQTLREKILKLLNIVDEHTSESLDIVVDRRIDNESMRSKRSAFPTAKERRLQAG
jgi:hypothetical protein